MKLALKLLVVCSCIALGNVSLITKANAQITKNYLITESSNTSEIKKVQTIFKRIGVYSGKIDGEYNSVRPTIINLQKEFSLIEDDSDENAGNLDVLLLKKTTSVYLKKLREKSQSEEVSNITTNRKFIVTAYYSPLPGQKKYSTGTYWGDIRLNGEGTHGASGAAVHEGFLAAPKNYPFGTKIYLEGIGVGVVEDRGGAIVNAGKRGYEHDRIDVWMGYGDAGLQKALQWGKRTVDGKILSDDAEIIQNFPQTVASDYYDLRVSPESNIQEIKELQDLLTEIHAYEGPIDGKYSSVEDALIEYQKEKNIISNRESNGAGYFGPKTFTAVQRDLAGKLKKSSPQGSKTVEKIDAFLNLTREEKKNIEKKKTLINQELEKKSGGNRLIIESYKRKIKQRLQDSLKNTTSNKEKEKVEYLLSLL